MKTGQIILYIVGIAIIGAIVYFLWNWRKKLETEKEQLQTGRVNFLETAVSRDIRDVVPGLEATQAPTTTRRN